MRRSLIALSAALLNGALVTSLPAQRGATTSVAKHPRGTIVVNVGGREALLSPAELASVPHRDYRIPADDGADTATVTGITLWDILEKAHATSAEASGRQRAATYLRLTGADGANAVVALVEVDPSFSRHTMIVIDKRKGQPLDDVEGPWRVIIPDEMRHARWIRGLVSIDVVASKP